MNCIPILFCVAVAITSMGAAIADDRDTFDPPVEYRTINFVEHGGGPIGRYVAAKIETSEVVYQRSDLKVVFTTSLPPSTATRTVVAGLFVLVPKGGVWTIGDARRFEAAGKYSGAKAEATQSEKAEPHISVVLHQGGRGHSYSQCASYAVVNGKFTLDTPKETTIGEQVSGGNGGQRR